MNNFCAIVLAGGDGKRMKSNLPKVLTNVVFDPMLKWVCDGIKDAGIEDICVVTGAKAEVTEKFIEEYDKTIATVRQETRLGTGHAVMQATDFLEKHIGDDVLILCGDAPLMDCETIISAYECHIKEKNSVTVISSNIEEPFGYGRILRNKFDRLDSIIEEKDCTEIQKQITEVNSGAYWFRVEDLLESLPKLRNTNASNEYYLTDTIKILVEEGHFVNAMPSDNANSVLGANNCLQLNELNNIARMAILERLMLDGINIPCSDGVLISKDVQIGRGTTILPGSILQGNTKIGEDCVIGANTVIKNSVIGDNCTLNSVQCYESTVDSNVTVGPFVHIRPNSHLCNGVKVGDFVEIKNSTIGQGSKVPHLTYVGDSDVGSNVNFGCGSVTVNYDGKNKHRTVIGDNVFIGCNTNLVAPVTLDNHSFTAAGSTITNNVPTDSLAIARSKQVNKDGWNKNK